MPQRVRRDVVAADQLARRGSEVLPRPDPQPRLADRPDDRVLTAAAGGHAPRLQLTRRDLRHRDHARARRPALRPGAPHGQRVPVEVGPRHEPDLLGPQAEVPTENDDDPGAALEVRDQRLEFDGRERPHLFPRRRRDLPQRARHVARHMPVLYRDLQDAREARHRFPHRVRRAPVVKQKLLMHGEPRHVKPGQRLIGQLDQVVLERPVVVLTRLLRERRGVGPEAGVDELGERQGRAIELAHQVRAQLQATPDLPVEQIRVALAIEGSRALPTALPPAHAPTVAITLHAHPPASLAYEPAARPRRRRTSPRGRCKPSM